MNKKGFTMVELMVSIGLIAIVMVFLVRLLVDVRYDVTNELYDTKDQINRAEIIKTIENDLKDKKIINVIDTGSSTNNLKITLNTLSGSAIIEIDSSDNFIYTPISGTKKKWSLKAKDSTQSQYNPNTHYKKTNVKCNVVRSTNTNDYLITINIPVLVDNSTNKKDSQMDNIILTFYGNSSHLTLTSDSILNNI